MSLKLFILQPEVVFAAQVLMAEISYPLADITFGSVTIGGATENPAINALAGYTVLFGSAPGLEDRGRSFIRRTSVFDDLLFIGYSSQGSHRGEVNIENGTYITCVALREVWSKPQRFVRSDFEPFIVQLKNFDESFENNGSGVEFYPKANTGPAVAGDIDAGTGLLTVDFDGSTSYSLPAGVGLTDYLWGVEDGSVTVGTSADAEITATYEAGFRYAWLRVTDANGLEHTAYRGILADDPDDSLCVDVWQIESWTSTQQGQQVDIRILSELPRSTYIDGTLVMIYDPDEPDQASRLKFIGWHHNDRADLQFVKTGFLRDTILECLDVGGKLDTLPGQSQVIENVDKLYVFTVADDAALGAELLTVAPLPISLLNGDTLDVNGAGTNIVTVVGAVAKGATAFGVAPLSAAITAGDSLEYQLQPRNWSQMYHPTMYLFIDHLLRYGSTALSLADWSWPSTEVAYHFIARESQADTLWRQVQEQARAIVPDHTINCTPLGQLIMRVDPMTQPPFLRTSVVQATLAGRIQAIRAPHTPPPRISEIRAGAMVEGWLPVATLPVEVTYTLRPSAETAIGSFAVAVYPIPATIPSGATVQHVSNPGGLLIATLTLTAEATEGATSLSVEETVEIIFEWDRLRYIAMEAGPEVIPTQFCIAPGKIPGQGAQKLMINNKITQSDATLQANIGALYARMNAEYSIFTIELAGGDDLGIDPSAMTWVNSGALDAKYIPQRALDFFPCRLLPLEVSRRYSYSKTGVVVSVSLRCEREVSSDVWAVLVTGEEF